MKLRIIEGVGASAFGMAITNAIQLISLSLFLYLWNKELQTLKDRVVWAKHWNKASNVYPEVTK